jgi:predicted permease
MPEWAADIRARLSSLGLSPAREAEIVEELSQHLDDRVRDLRASGLDAAAARRGALDELCEPGALARWMGPLRQARVPEPPAAGAPARSVAGDAWRDVRYAVRLLRKQPGFAAAAVVTLALGIGANTAIFSLVNAALLQRLPVADGDRLAAIYSGAASTALSYPDYVALRDGNRTLDGLAAWANISVSVNADGATDLVRGGIVSGNFFELLGVASGRGRLLSAQDDVTPGGHRVAVIGHDLWRTRFASRADVIGREMALNGQPFTIVGVAPPGFHGPRLGTVLQLYVPMMMQPVVRPPSGGYSGERDPDLLTKPMGWLSAIGRLRDGVTLTQAAGELSALATAAARTPQNPVQLSLVPVDDGDPVDHGRVRSAAWLLGGVVGVVLLIACANIANLLLSRNASRQREIAVRLAVGASRARLVRQLLTESVVLAGIGGGAGVGLAWLAIQALQAAPPPPMALPLALEVSLDRPVLFFSLALSVATGLAFGVAPAVTASRAGLVTILKQGLGGRRPTGSRFEVRQLLVVAQVALSLVLLIAAGLFVRSLQSAQAIDPGLDVARVLSAPLNINLLRYTTVQGREFYARAVARIGQVPGVESASVARVAVMTGSARRLPLMIEGQAGSSADGRVTDGPRVDTNVVGSGFFSTLGIALLSGRDFTHEDIEGRPLVAIVNETTAKRYFGGDTPLGRRVRFGPNGPWREIVGVARDSTYRRLGEGALPAAYLPLSQNHETGMTLYVRAAVPPASLVAAIRRELQALEPNLPVPNTQTMGETIGASLYPARLGAWLLGGFGVLALMLAAVGVYGVLSFAIAQRTRELGIRLALGADTRSLFALVLRYGMRMVAIGIAVGLAVGFAGARSLESMLYGVSGWDAATFVTVTVVLAAAALAACAIPARRAMRADPMAPLRAE